MARCGAIKANGERCKADAMPGEEWCYSHHPNHTEERRRRASRGGKAGGRGRPNGELREIKALCEGLTGRVLAGEVPPGVAAVANQLVNTRLRAVEQERKVKETEELERRIEALEQRTENGRSGRWGA